MKVRVFGNQKVANIGFKWPTKSLNEDKNSFLPKMYSYDVIYLQNRRFDEVVFYLKETNVLLKTEHAKIWKHYFAIHQSKFYQTNCSLLKF